MVTVIDPLWQAVFSGWFVKIVGREIQVGIFQIYTIVSLF